MALYIAKYNMDEVGAKMTDPIEVTTDVACRIVGMNPLRLNEHVAAGRFPCMPGTIRGRYRVFGIDDLLALWLFRTFLERGFKVKDAGYFACDVAGKARSNPDEPAISVVEYVNGAKSVHVAASVPEFSEWDKVMFSGSFIFGVTTYNVKFLREFISSQVENEAGK
ncbi:hypothetical protein [Rhizobium sp. GN54]|uniref:hypothetical protein n=1 Tax=Rhizobium sp. GN54 TaxID=2898150 RepID=UPI001E36EEB2|nr:hypothetical protein [Rhizobium sp. GN54]MCD2183500.1 hypothetical protein [Rhizobium sp. GN54]